VLPAQPTQDAVTERRERVEELERCAERENGGGEADDFLVGGEEVRDVVFKGAEEDYIEDADDQGAEEGDSGGCFGGVDESCADEVGDAG
jgi:hypothetical protein